jgi:hypothetical protein
MAPPDVGESISPATEYGDRLRAHRTEEAKQLRLYRSLVRGKSLTVGILIALVLLTDKEPFATIVAVLTFPSILTLALIVRRWRAARALQWVTRAASYCEKRLACLDGRWPGRGEPGTEYLDPDHPAALDLDLFGTGSLYELLCTARTRPGQDTLAAWLATPADVEEVRARQAAVAALRPRLEFREELAVLGSALPRHGLLDALARWGAEGGGPSLPHFVHWVTWAMPVVTLTALIGWWRFGTGPGVFLITAVLQTGLAVWLHRYSRRILAWAEAGRPALKPLAAFLARLDREHFSSLRLGQLGATLHTSDGPAPKSLRQLDRALGWAILATLLGCRPQLALLVDAWRRRNGTDFGRWLKTLGEIEALCALATHAYENPRAVFPEVVREGPCFEAERLGHPLLPPERCVPNDVSLGGDVRLLVVSGSNMSGKSTLLRTVGINVALALAGAPVRATRLRLSPLVVGATLRVQDSLQAGRSRFYAEALRVRQLLDLTAGSVPLLFLLDELFQGTNSQDRRMGAEAVLRRLLDRGAVGLVTTHDLALTGLVEGLPGAVNVHFEDRFADGAMTFDYRLRPGVVPTSNGLALLRAVGIEV